jgi:hypothetical protein
MIVQGTISNIRVGIGSWESLPENPDYRYIVVLLLDPFP